VRLHVWRWRLIGSHRIAGFIMVLKMKIRSHRIIVVVVVVVVVMGQQIGIHRMIVVVVVEEELKIGSLRISSNYFEQVEQVET